MSKTIVALLPSESNVSSPPVNYAKIVATNNDTVSRVISTTVVPDSVNSRRRNGNNASRSSTRKKQLGNDFKNVSSSSPSPETLERNKQSHRRSRRTRRRLNKKQIDSGIISPSVVSSCSMVSIATTSSGLSSNTSSIRAINDAVEELTCSDPVENSSSAASSAGFCDMTSTDGADEDDFSSEHSGVWNYREDPSVLEPSFMPEDNYRDQWSAVSSQGPTKSKNRKSRNKHGQSTYQYPSLSDPDVQKYYHQQRLFYRMIYEQQFAVLNAINSGGNTMDKKDTKSIKSNKYVPHQHLGLPPMPPPPQTSSWYYASFQSFMESPNFLEVQSPCEAAFLEHLRSHSIKNPHQPSKEKTETSSTVQKQPKKVLKNSVKKVPLISLPTSSFDTTKNNVNPDSQQLREEFRRQIHERLLGASNGEKQRKKLPRNLVLKKDFVVGEEDFPPISEVSSPQNSSPKIRKHGATSRKLTKTRRKRISTNRESGYHSESSPNGGEESQPIDISSNISSNCSSPKDYSSVVAGCSPKLSSVLNLEPETIVSDSGKLAKTIMPAVMSKLDYLSDSIYEYYETVAQTEKTLLKKLRLRDMLYYTIASCFPVCGLYIVGSSLNGFGNDKSDMDICLVITNRELDQKTDAIQVLKAVEQLLANMPFVDTYQLIEAKVPILRILFSGAYEGLTVDLNANNSVAIKNTHLLYYYAISDWRVRPLVSVVKEWAKRCNINDASQSSFTSYSLVLMVIHYLQCGLDQPILPSLQSTHSKNFHSKTDIRTLNLSMKLEPPVAVGNPNISLGELLIGFFKYYSSTFNYDKNAISVRLGKIIDRSELAARGGLQWSPICIEEPFTKLNTAHSIFDVNVFTAIVSKFQEAHEILTRTSDINELLSVKPYQNPYNAVSSTS